MYPIFLAIHNFFRWIVIIMAILALVRAYLGWFGNRNWTERDARIGSFLAMSVDIQLLLGLILYIFLSPLTTRLFQDFGSAMQDPTVRFFGIEHLVYMLVAVALIHIGNSRTKKADQSTLKFRNAAIFFSLAILLVLIAIPWSRPLLRGF
jgi:hypothetical protein